MKYLNQKKSLLKLVLISVLVLLCSNIYAEYFNIQDYNVNVKIFKDSSAEFTETLLVKFLSPRHGIFRFIPYKYSKKKFHIKILKVESSFNGEYFSKEPFLIKKRKGYLIIRIGSKKKLYQGLRYYKIVYKIFDAVNNNEFFWNIIGYKWPVFIRNAYINIECPDILDYNVYSKASIDFNLSKNSLTLKKPVYLPPYNGITVKLSFVPGSISEVPFYRKIIWFFYDYLGYFLFIFISIIMFFIWKAWGKDEPKGVIVVQYKPPKDLTPAEVGTLIDDKVDLKDVTATILDLGVKGFIKIEKKNGKLTFLKLKNDDSSLKEHEKIIFNGLFPYGVNKSSIDLLKNQFYITVATFKELLYRYISDKSHLYTINPEKIRNFFQFAGYFFIIAGICLGFLGFKLDLGIGMVLSGLIIMFFSRIMPQKSHKGAKLFRDILGFKEFIERVDKDRLKKFAENDPEIFGRLLPYAIALGVEEKWAKKFEGIDVSPPSYYYLPYGMDTFSTVIFFNILTNDLNNIHSTFIPENKGIDSDSFSGISLGSGGFGGGFGGGGGGSW